MVDITKRERSPGVYEYALETAEEYLLSALYIIERLQRGEQALLEVDGCEHEFVRINMESISIYACKKNCGLARKVS